ncbi:MAG: putative acyl-CoA dehydrogenase [Frankiales bacterium]|nr:putative acyl-CoA dehydrogenase [Frankiales bacterium]
MDLLTDPTITAFREEARTWLEENKPTEARPHDDQAAREFDRAWQHKQYEGGWAGVAWPEEFGGRGLAPLQQMIWYEEMVRAGAPSTGSFTVALGHAGPTIMANGTKEQQALYLDRIISGDTPWCQGFSEPGSGSDLASLRTRAVIDGDELVVNGQKIWTSYAHIADFQELLVRTDPEAPKHKGITWVVMAMDTPGLTVRPIQTIDGNAHFCECFYDDVRIPLANVVGGLNNGWRTAMSTLSFERGMGYLQSRLTIINEVDKLIEEARQRKLLENDRIAYELAHIRAQAVTVHALGYDGVAATSQPELMSSVNQIFNGELSKSLARIAIEIQGDDGLERTEWNGRYLGSFPATIAGGSKDIQKNILGERVLGLPR